MQTLTGLITAADPATRNQSLDALCAAMPLEELLGECAELDRFRRRSENLYERVRALFFLYAIHRFHLPLRLASATPNTPHATHLPPHASRPLIPFKGYEHLLQRRFEEAIDVFLKVQEASGPDDAISSALAAA